MNIDFDMLQALLWSIAYIFIIVYQIKERLPGIPPVALATNFAWETVAFAQDIFVYHSWSAIHIMWLSLDIVIAFLYLALCPLGHLKKKKYFWTLYAFEIVLFALLFLARYGMLISSFAIDFLMAVQYFFYTYQKKMRKNVLSVAICVFKLFGDLCALLAYKQYSPIVFCLGAMVLLLNIACLLFLLIKPKTEERKRLPKCPKR